MQEKLKSHDNGSSELGDNIENRNSSSKSFSKIFHDDHNG